MLHSSDYFKYFPFVAYDLTGLGNPIVVPNIFFRMKIMEAIRQNSVIYYPYYCQENDTPEIIADKYYKDQSLGWLILMTNNMIDPQYDWFLSYDMFINYLNSKYGSVDTAQTQIYSYTKTVTRVNSLTQESFATVSNIDAVTYTNTPASVFQEVGLTDGSSVAITTSTQIVYAFDYEYNLNEQKRNIQIISKVYMDQIVQEMLILTNNAKGY